MKTMEKRSLNRAQLAIAVSERAFGKSAVNVISIKLTLDEFTAQQVKEAVETVFGSADIFTAVLDMEEEGLFFRTKGREAASCRILRKMAYGEARRYVEEKDYKPLNYPQELYEAVVIPLQEGGTVLYVRFHHIIIDGYGMCLFAQRTLDVLAGKAVEPSVFFGGTSAEGSVGKDDSDGCFDDSAQADGKFWTDYFSCAQFEPAVFSETPKSMGMARVSNMPEEGMEERMACFAAEHGVTVPYVLASAYAVWLSGAAGKEDAVFLMPRLNRDAGTRQTIGCYTLLVPVCVNVRQEDTFADICRKTQEAARTASLHKTYGYEQILQTLRGEHMAQESLSEYVFNYYRYKIKSGLEYSLDISVAGAMHNHFTWNVFWKDEGMSFVFDLRDGVYNTQRAEYFADSIANILRCGMEGNSVRAIPLVGKREQERLSLIRGEEIAVDEHATIPSLFGEAVKKYGDRPALYAGSESYTFEKLDRVSDAIACSLVRRGVQAGDCVAFMLKRDIRLIPAMFGIAKAGAAFIPVDPAYPKERIDYILADSHAKYLISSPDVEAAAGHEYLAVDELSKDTGERFRLPKIRQEDLAYLIYTSGTTGKPKGVMLSHRGIANIVHPRNNPFNRDMAKNGRGIVAIGSICFDISLFEIFVPLLNGLFVELGNEKAMLDAGELARHISKHGADILHCTPSRLASYLKNPEFAAVLPGVRMVLSAGELLPEGLVHELKDHYGIRIYNGYGPTETTIGATITEAGDSQTIGAPIANTGVLILNQNGKQAPYGAVGEICVYGNGVGIGYRGRKEETEEKFTDFGGMRIYHTGDLGHLLPDGRLSYHGRNDRQIKLRGLRIELSEIEKAMGAYEGVALACCIVKKIDRTKHLAGFYTPEGGCAVDAEGLRTFLKEILAPYMVPDILKELDEMPQTPGGKVDMKALERVPVEFKRPYRAPENGIQTAVCNAFAAALGILQAGLDDNFFELGGDSLNAMNLVAEIEKELARGEGEEVDYAAIFKYPTPALLAEYLEEQEKEAESYPIDGLDYTGIAERLSEGGSVPKDGGMQAGGRRLGNILLTGATGYLGIHILIDLLRNPGDSGKIFCLTRPSERLSALRRMKSALFYYAEEDFSKSYGEKWAVVEGDVTDPQIFKEEFSEHVDTIINSAANVAHFAYGDGLERVNTDGVKNLARYALKEGAMLCHVSTISVGGMRDASLPAGERLFTEEDLYIGQKICNPYIYSKYMAEYALLKAAAGQGLAVKIMRVGNLQGRIRDGEFQMNLKSNAFTRQLSSYIKMGMTPESVYHASVNFAPVDETAHMIRVLAGTGERRRVFHVYPPEEVSYAGLFTALGRLGHQIEVVTDEEFDASLQALKRSDEGRALAEGLLVERPDSRYREIPVTQEMTQRLLGLFGESWTPATEEYLGQYLNALEGMALF